MNFIIKNKTKTFKYLLFKIKLSNIIKKIKVLSNIYNTILIIYKIIKYYFYL